MKKFRLTAAIATLGLALMAQPRVLLAQSSPAPVCYPGAGSITFPLHVNPKFLGCLADGSGSLPTAIATVTRGNLNDTLCLSLAHIKPGLNFDLFTVERSNLLPNGSVDPDFKNIFHNSFGLAWYQSDIHINSGSTTAGTGKVTIKTILLDQIFGFDPDLDVGLAPTNTFHIGFWFNDPKDAAACGFTGFTPFNGEHHAGPLAMISVPNPHTDLGPLCTNPDTSTNPPHCNP
jgi:hypothetical protein